MKKVILSVALVFLVTVAFAENSIKKSISGGSFNSIEVASMFEIEVVKSSSCAVEVEIPERFEKYLVARVDGNTFELYLDNMPNKNKIKSEDVFKAVIYTPSLSEVELSGAVKAVFRGDFDESEFEMDLSGAVNVTGLKVSSGRGSVDCSGASKISDSELNIAHLELDCSGASKVEFTIVSNVLNTEVSGAANMLVKGAAEVVNIDASGAAKLNFAKFAVQNADVECSGAAKLDMSVMKSLSVEASGASELKYTAGEDLKITGIDISGAARVKSL